MLIAWLCYGFNKVKTFDEIGKKQTTFSVIVPFRNELAHLPQLLESITALDYPLDKFEFLLVDDDSTDKSVEIISTFIIKNGIANFELISNNRKSNSPKKDAITTAIKQTKYKSVGFINEKSVFRVVEKFSRPLPLAIF